MSFILDALKKSETERQQQQAAEFSAVPSGHGTAPAPRWLWALGVLLAVNLLVVGGLWLRPDSPPAPTGVQDRPTEKPATVPATHTATDAGTDAGTDAAARSFTERVATARRDLAPPPEPTPATNITDQAEPAAPAAATRAPAGVATLPSLEELQLDGAINLPPLHIDLHVYNDAPDRRFVSINMNKYRENERLSEGPVVRHITREGVVLEYEGRMFALLQ